MTSQSTSSINARSTLASYTVQEAAERTGLSAHTLRYYERAGLLPRVERVVSSGHRRYSDEDLRLLEFLKRMRATGMPIHQMQRYMTLVREGDRTNEARRALLEQHRCAVCAHIAELQEHLAVIEYKIANYGRLLLENAVVADACSPKEKEE